jgi:hypothetical protein
MTSEKQMELFTTTCKEDEDTTLHLDATGSVMQRIRGQQRPLYYCLFLAKLSIPVFDVLTTTHKSVSIQGSLDEFNSLVRQINNGKVVKPRYIVTDFSYAIINACLQSFNNLSLLSYLRRCFNILQVKVTQHEISSITFIVLCHAHIMKTVSMSVSRAESDTAKRKKILVLFSALSRTTDLTSAKATYNMMHTALCTKVDNGAVEAARERLTELCIDDVDCRSHSDNDKPYARDNHEQANNIDVDSDEVNTERSIKSQSPFTTYFADALDLTSNSDDVLADSTLNSWYSASGFEVISQYIHLYPLWSASLQADACRFAPDFMGSRQLQAATRRTNAAIEAHFRAVKHSKLFKRRSVRPREFIDAHAIGVFERKDQ